MANYNEVLRLSDSLTLDEKMQLIEALSRLIRQQINLSQKTPSSIENTNVDSDPLVGLFASTSDLATRSEEILQQEITEKSGWTWKESQP
ncbi:MAG: hypothetical protein RIE73_13800 [Coleofasciculus sp. C1-SOL-03]|jgi:hypothetical protein|uniref:hypothetical protein n=1 Tax=Coleofasciculus sp. C1-SOL-03 TaxID=3069522 RepID=UPI003303B388